MGLEARGQQTRAMTRHETRRDCREKELRSGGPQDKAGWQKTAKMDWRTGRTRTDYWESCHAGQSRNRRALMNRGLDWLWMRRGSVTVWREYDRTGVWLVSRSLDRSPGDCLSLCVWSSWACDWMGVGVGVGGGWVSEVEQAGPNWTGHFSKGWRV